MKRIKIAIQHDAMQCGIACLQMICMYHGKEYSMDALSRICFATTEGVSLMGINEAACQLGLHTVCGRVALSQIAKAPLPCILHWNQNHFVVLYKVKRGRYYVADPAKGLVTYSQEEFCRNWLSMTSQGVEKGIAMLLNPTPAFYERTEVESGGERRSFRFLMGYVRQHRRKFWAILAGLAIGCGLQLLLPFLTQAIVDTGIKNQDIGFIWLILLGQLMLTVSRAGIDFVRRWQLLRISMNVNISLVCDFFIKLLKLPMSFFDTKLMGDLLQRMDDHRRVERFLTTQMLSVAFSLIGFMVFGAVLLWYSRLIFAVFILGSVLYGGWIAVFLGRRKVIDHELFEQQARNQNKTYQFVTSMQEIKLQDCEQRRRREWEEVQHDLYGVQMKSLKLQQAQEAGCILINESKNILITVLAATSVISGEMTLGMMLAVQYIIGQLNSPVEQLLRLIYSLQDVKISLERINEIHMSDNEESRENQAKAFVGEKSISLSDVSFRYDPHSHRKTIDGVSLSIPAGKVTAIVGASGSGKTTLVKLILGYYRVESGRLSIGGRDISEYNLKWWRRQCGAVMQDGVIFSESIARNIAVDDNEIDDERMRRAAATACIGDYIESLPLKYDTLIGRDGVGLSQGQKQRILIARAIYKNPDFIFLDEATNALDAKNERAIVENLSEFYRGRTVVVVAHRLSTVKNADHIVVVDGGRIVEAGTHSELTAQRGAYYNLVRNQLELGC